MSTQPTRAPSCADEVEVAALTVDEARTRIMDAVRPVIGIERLAIRTALGRVLAEAVCSPLDVPAHTNSAMDGYALAADSLPATGEVAELEMIGAAFAGVPFEGECGAGQCVRIMTGAPLPPGTDTVVMQEHVERVGESGVRIGAGHRLGQNVRHAGEDIAAGSEVFEPGRCLTPADIGVIASLGQAEVAVHRRLRAAFFSTGDELRSLGEVLGPGQIYDSNRYTLHGMLTRLGCEIVDMGVVRDTPEAVRRAFTEASAVADVVITSGGVSVGEADYIKPVLDELGDIAFFKIAMKPGRPLTFGQLGNAMFFGLPGNPVSVMATFYLFVQAALQKMMGMPPAEPLLLDAICATPLRNKSGRYEFQRGVLGRDEEGRLTVAATGDQGSGILTSMSRADCFILLPIKTGTREPGDIVQVQPFVGMV
jgi:molybdopterin molybdotransferase